MIPHRPPFGLALLALVGVVLGCADAIRTVVDQHPKDARTARVYLHSASAEGPVLLQIRDNPFPGTDRTVASAMARAASHTVTGLNVRVTDDAAAAFDRDYRLVVAFNPGPTVTSEVVCGPSRPMVPKVSADRLTAMVAFCYRDAPVVSIDVVAPPASGPDAPVLGQMVQRAMLDMFPPVGQARDGSTVFWPDD
jgi:hypothetical protein